MFKPPQWSNNKKLMVSNALRFTLNLFKSFEKSCNAPLGSPEEPEVNSTKAGTPRSKIVSYKLFLFEVFVAILINSISSSSFILIK